MADLFPTPIPLSVPILGENEAKYVQECLETNWVSYAGPFVDRFEAELSSATGARHSVATASGTAALHIALLLAGVSADTEVVMPGLTFVAPANAIRYCGAWPTLIDLAADSWQMDVAMLEDFLRDGCDHRIAGVFNRTTGRRIAAILPVHLLGGMCDVNAVAEIAAKYELWLIEDAAECLGATCHGRPIGSPIPSFPNERRIVATSFNGNKIITTGGGGAILTDNADLARHAKHLTTTAKTDPIEFHHDEVGYNYRMTNLAAAMGVAQLESLEERVAAKRMIAARYGSGFSQQPEIVTAPEPAWCQSTFWLYSILAPGESRGMIAELNRLGIMCRPLWKPIHRLPMFADTCHCVASSNIDQIAERAISLPSSSNLNTMDQDFVIEAVLQAVADER